MFLLVMISSLFGYSAIEGYVVLILNSVQPFVLFIHSRVPLGMFEPSTNAN